MDDTPDPAFSVLFKHSSNLLRPREIALVGIYLGALKFPLSGVGWKLAPRQLGDTVKGFGPGVVVVVDRDDLVLPGFLQHVDDV